LITRLLIGIVAFSALIIPGLARTHETSAAAYVFETQMFGQNQVPPVNTVGWGFFRFFFNEDRSAADVTVDIKGLAGDAIISADIHRGAAGTNGPVVKHLADGGYIVTAAHVTFTKAELAEMASGNWYISLKTETHPDGELRGQIMPPADFLPSVAAPTAVPTRPAENAPPAQQQPQTPAPSGSLVISPPNTGDGGLVR
jgi:hypothetical protein